MTKKLLGFIFFLFVSALALAQSSTLKGIVKDTTGKMLPYATVILQKNGTEIGATQTDESGTYSFKALNAGNYDVEVSYVGYQKERMEGTGGY